MRHTHTHTKKRKKERQINDIITKGEAAFRQLNVGAENEKRGEHTLHLRKK